MNKTDVFYTLQWLALVVCMFLASPWLAVAFAGPFAAIAYIMAWDIKPTRRKARSARISRHARRGNTTRVGGEVMHHLLFAFTWCANCASLDGRHRWRRDTICFRIRCDDICATAMAALGAGFIVRIWGVNNDHYQRTNRTY